VHRSITLIDFQLDAQNSYLFIYDILLKSSTCFEHYPAHLQEVHVVIVYIQPLVSPLSAGDCPVHRLRKKWVSSFLTGVQDSHLHRVMISEAACIQLRRGPPEDEQGNARNM
jgi:predicted RNase H-like nuclease